MIKISKKQAREFLITYQGIHKQMKGQDDILTFIKKVGCIQFDPVDVSGRNHDLVLQSRIKHYRPEQIQTLLYEDRKLIDGLDKNMSIYPIQDWHYLKRLRQVVEDWRKIKKGEYVQVLEQVRKRIAIEGPMSSRDLKMDKKIDWWWSKTNIGRAVLDTLYYKGELIVVKKDRNIRYFDYAAKYIPESLYNSDDPNETMEEYQQWHLKRRINSIGLLWNKQSSAFLGIIGFKPKQRNKAFKNLLKKNEIVEVLIEDINETFYCTTENAQQLESKNVVKSQISFIAALDNLIWDRSLLSALFDFEYTWEIYKPKEKREYGYYVLPVVYKDKFVARFEPKRETKQGQLHVNNWWWETGIKKTDKMRREINVSLEAFTEFTGMKEWVVNCEI